MSASLINVPSVGEQLRAGREERQLTIDQIAEMTKIKTEHVRALEAGRFDEFSALIYVRGFVRTYARLLKLDLQELMVDLDEELMAAGLFGMTASVQRGGGEPGTGGLGDILQRVNLRLVVSLVVLSALFALMFMLIRHLNRKPDADAVLGVAPARYVPNPAPPGREHYLELKHAIR